MRVPSRARVIRVGGYCDSIMTRMGYRVVLS